MLHSQHRNCHWQAVVTMVPISKVAGESSARDYNDWITMYDKGSLLVLKIVAVSKVKISMYYYYGMFAKDSILLDQIVASMGH